MLTVNGSRRCVLKNNLAVFLSEPKNNTAPLVEPATKQDSTGGNGTSRINGCQPLLAPSYLRVSSRRTTKTMAGGMSDTLELHFAPERSSWTAKNLARTKSSDTFCWNSIVTFSYQYEDQLGLHSPVQWLWVSHKREQHTKVPRMSRRMHPDFRHTQTLLKHSGTFR